jgi:serine/threonine protein phosphatase PrpC
MTSGAGPKPWIGSGMARPVEFGKPINYMTWLLLATDGLVKYTSPEVICDVVRSTPLDEAPRRLIELVRYPTGRLPDDVAVIVARWVRNETGG